MKTNAHRTLRISLAALVVLLFAVQSFAAQTYTVGKGDTLHKIAQKFHISDAVLQKANGVKNPNVVRLGQVLTIPSAQASNPVTYGHPKVDKLAVTSGDKVIASLPKDAKFVVISREGGKYNIKLSDGNTGWVDAEKVTLEETRKPLPVSDSWSMKPDIVRLAYSYRGARYRYGGTSAGGFDCSGFVKYIYGKKGINLPHSSSALYSCGKPVAKSSDLQPGDLVFFAGTYRHGISHVGIYIGDGKFIHASTHRGGVRVDYLNTDYYRRHYVGARRI